jgi:hypothetical protein
MSVRQGKSGEWLLFTHDISCRLQVACGKFLPATRDLQLAAQSSGGELKTVMRMGLL